MILVTGSTGLIGSHLLLFLTRKDLRVRAMYHHKNHIKKTENLFRLYSAEPEKLLHLIDWVKADITDITSLPEIMEDISHVYHTAALVSFNPKDKKRLHLTNVDGTANMLQAAMDAGVKKFLHFSSIASLGGYEQPITEKTIWNWKEPHSEYAVTKYLSEMEVWRASQEGLPVIILNPSIVLGAGFWNEGTGKIIKKADKKLWFYPPGANNFVDVWDVVKAGYQLMQTQIINESFIVGGNHISYKELLNLISQALGKKPPEFQLPAIIGQFAWRTEWILNKIFGKKPVLTKSLYHNLFQKRQYSSDKLIKTLSFQFIPIGAAIRNIVAQYQKNLNL
jgi:nucleoside-diphosphate-sugar epimerase